MPDTYTRLRYHLVFSTKDRAPLITDEVRDDLYAYLGGILRGNGGTLSEVGGMPDHVHLLAGWKTSISVAKMLQLVKTNSSKWMNERAGVRPGSFAWQTGYGATTGRHRSKKNSLACCTNMELLSIPAILPNEEKSSAWNGALPRVRRFRN